MRIFSIIRNGRRSYRIIIADNAGVLSVYVPTKQAQKMIRNLGS